MIFQAPFRSGLFYDSVFSLHISLNKQIQLMFQEVIVVCQTTWRFTYPHEIQASSSSFISQACLGFDLYEDLLLIQNQTRSTVSIHVPWTFAV